MEKQDQLTVEFLEKMGFSYIKDKDSFIYFFKNRDLEQKLICDFMGFIKEDDFEEYNVRMGNIKEPYCSIKFMKFDSSFDWLMPVVEKIEKMSVNFHCHALEDHVGVPTKYLTNFTCYAQPIWDNKNHCISGDTGERIYSIYTAVVKFIYFYNELKNNKQSESKTTINNEDEYKKGFESFKSKKENKEKLITPISQLNSSTHTIIESEITGEPKKIPTIKLKERLEVFQYVQDVFVESLKKSLHLDDVDMINLDNDFWDLCDMNELDLVEFVIQLEKNLNFVIKDSIMETWMCIGFSIKEVITQVYKIYTNEDI